MNILFGVYLLIGLATWKISDNTAKAFGEEECDALEMVGLIAFWPYMWYTWLVDWFTDDEVDEP